MPTMPWKQFTAADPERSYAALVSYLPLKKYLTVPRFLWYTLQIQKQLKHSPGLVGYSLRAKILAKSFWTLSAWESDAALQAFVRKQPHSSVMAKLSGSMAPTAFRQWTANGADLPLDLDKEIPRLTGEDKK